MDRDMKNKRKEKKRSDGDGSKDEIGWVEKIKLLYPYCLVLILVIPMSLFLLTLCSKIAVLTDAQRQLLLHFGGFSRNSIHDFWRTTRFNEK